MPEQEHKTEQPAELTWDEMLKKLPRVADYEWRRAKARDDLGQDIGFEMDIDIS